MIAHFRKAMRLMCLVGALFTVSMPALSFDTEIEEHHGENLAQPFILDISVSEGTQKLVQVSQKRGDVVLELKEDSTQRVIKRVDFPTEYPFDETILISKNECAQKCTLLIRAKNQIDAVLPFNVRALDIGVEHSAITYLQALSQTGELAHGSIQASKSQSENIFINIISRLKSTLDYTDKNHHKNYRALIHMRMAESYDFLNNVIDRKAQLLNLQEDLGNHKSIYGAYSNYELGAVEEKQSREIQLYKSGMKISQELGEPIVWAIGANYLATKLIDKGEFKEAIDLLVRAEEAFKEHGSIFWMSTPLNNLSWANYRASQFDTALKYAAQLKLIAENYQDTENELWSLYNLGFIYQQKGDLAVAQEFINKSLAGIDSPNVKLTYKSLNTLRVLLLKQKSILLRDQGAYVEALDVLKELKQAVAEQNQVKRIPDVLVMESEIYLELGELQLAEKTLQEAIEISKDSERKIFLAKCYRQLAEIKLERNDTLAALGFLTDAINMLETNGDHVALTRLLIYTLEGLTLAGGIQQAAELLPKIDYLVQENGVGLDKVEYGHTKAAILVEMGNFDQARTTLSDALDEVKLLLSKVKRKDLRRSYFSLQKDLYELLILITIQTNPDNPKKSLEVAEEFKGLTIEEDLRKLSRNSEVDGTLIKRRHHLHSQLLTASKTFNSSPNSSVLKEARILSSELEEVEALIEWGDSPTVARALGPKLQPIPNGDTVLYYFLGQEKSWCWVLNESHVDVITLPTEKVILAQSKPVIATYSVPPAARSGSGSWEDRQALIQLSDTLLKGAFSALKSRGKTVKKLVVVRDGILSNVPYAQLVSPQSEKYLVENHAILYAASIESWQQLKQRAKGTPQTNKLTLVSSSAGYESGNLRLPSLVNTDAEASKIARLFGHNARTISDAIDQNANLDQLLSEPVDVLHFATHVSLNVESPYLSFLLLPENSSKERLWLSTQISSRKISANTVVLSGCESASGKLDAGEGMLSISRAFIEAGATNVIGSTRKIQDDSSAILMAYMYEGLKNESSLAISLQQAQVDLASQHPEFMDPYFWAGYQLMGAG